MAFNALREFWKHEAAGGFILFFAAVLAVVFQNSALQPFYTGLQHLPVNVLGKELTLVHWVNDLFMALFFLVVGMEIKREIVEGELSTRSQLVLPLLGAVGGMGLPALVYLFFNNTDPVEIRGWAIPAATDIAFALGVIAAFGSRVPVSLKVFLTTLAILDDLGAILIIAFFYSANLRPEYLGASLLVWVALYMLNRLGVKKITPFMLLGAVLWTTVYASGVHATLAGVALATTIPLHGATPEASPLRRLTHSLHGGVTFLVLPLFSFLNAGVSLSGFGLDILLSPVPLGIMLGLFLGKQFGVFVFCWFAIRMGWARRPSGSTWAQFYAVSILTGIGFTMSLFIGGLAFPDQRHAEMLRVGVISGSLLSMIAGAALLHFSLPEPKRKRRND